MMTESTGLASVATTPAAGVPSKVVTTVTSPSLSSQASSFLVTVSNSTGHILSSVSSGIRPEAANATTAATPAHSLSPPNGTTGSEMSSTVTYKISSPSPDLIVTTASPVITGNVTGLQNVTVDSHSLSPHELVPDHETYLMQSVAIQTVLIVCLVAVLFGVVYILRKKHLDRLRHHLMPVYNFDPADDGEDWETELLDDQFVHCPPSDASQTLASGQLKLDTGLTRGLRVQQNNNSSTSAIGASKSSSMSPTAMSGLLSSGSDSGSHIRRMYTSERDPVA